MSALLEGLLLNDSDTVHQDVNNDLDKSNDENFNSLNYDVVDRNDEKENEEQGLSSKFCDLFMSLSSNRLIGVNYYSSSHITDYKKNNNFMCDLLYVYLCLKFPFDDLQEQKIHKHYVVFDACCEMFSTGIGYNNFGGYFKYNFLCMKHNYISNIFSSGYEYKHKLTDDFYIKLGIGFCYLMNLKYEEEDKEILFRKYSFISCFNPVNYNFDIRNYLSIGCVIYFIHINYKLIDLSRTFCFLPFVAFMKNILSSKTVQDIDIKLKCPVLLDRCCDISIDLFDIFIFLKKHNDQFNEIGDW